MPKDAVITRRGSVLIMVVSLLVLLAIAGFAWIATSRVDRVSSDQNRANTQIALLADGLRSMITGAIVDGVFGQSVDNAGNVSDDSYYRPRSDAAAQYNYTPVLGIVRDLAYGPLDKRNHPYMAARVPEIDMGSPIWRCISAPPGKGVRFESPLNGTSIDPASRYNVTITSVNIGGTPWPALTFRDPISGAATTVLAADTDGDGIADAALWPLPLAESDGVKWYAAMRVIDNNSAVNASVAWQWADNTSTPTGNFFPVNVNLQGMLANNAAGQMAALNNWRFNGVPGTAIIDDTGAARSDAVWLSPWEQLWMQLGRRMQNPGYNTPGVKFQALSSSDTAALAYRFTLRNPWSSGSMIESLLNQNLAAPAGAFSPTDTAPWMNYITGQVSLRTLLVASNASSCQMPQVRVKGPGDPSLPSQIPGSYTLPFGDASPRASLNNSDFPELLRAFWSVMVDKAGPGVNTGDPNRNWTTPVDAGMPAAPIYDPYLANRFDSTTFANVSEPHPARQFRSVLRDHRTPVGAASGTLRLPPDQMVILRSALAAVNTMNLRNPSGPNQSGSYFVNTSNALIRLPLQAYVGDTPQMVYVDVYGAGRQPFITEIYASTDIKTASPINPAAKNTKGYIGIELHNPYSIPLNLRNYRIGTVDRSVGAYPRMPVTELANLGTNVTIPPGGYVLIENYRTDNGGTAKFRPKSTGLPQNGAASADGSITTYYVSNLDLAFGNELVISRPRWEYGSQAFADAVPVDQFDFTGLTLPSPTADPVMATVWHYCRASSQADGKTWQCVFPGRYDGSLSRLRHQGTQEAVWNASDPATPDPWVGNPPTPGMSLGKGSYTPSGAAAANADSSYKQPFPPIQIANMDWAGVNTPTAATNNRFPYGGFARVGDMLQVPFIGAYRICIDNPGTATPTTVTELHSVCMDSVFANDGDDADDAVEALGRFVPIKSGAVDDWAADPTKWRYHFAMNIFEYFSVLTPHLDYLPSVPYNAPNGWTSSWGYYDTTQSKWIGLTAPKPVANADPTRVNSSTNPNEDTIGVEGLININTAPVKVLAALPMIPSSANLNLALAQAIVDDRAANGPFRTPWDLYRVPGFVDGKGTINLDGDRDGDQGDISPAGPGSDDVAGDFEVRNAMLIRISNLVTTRSDSFTCYGIIQGWRGAGSANPELVVQRRVGFLLDRTNITPTIRTPQTVNVPQE